MVQTRQGVRSTKLFPTNKKVQFPKPQSLPYTYVIFNPPNNAEPETATEPPAASNELHIGVQHLRKLYTDVTGRFLVKAHSGNQYIMVDYPFQSNAILLATFQSRKDTHRLGAYTSIMQRLKEKGPNVDHCILDNEASK